MEVRSPQSGCDLKSNPTRQVFLLKVLEGVEGNVDGATVERLRTSGCAGPKASNSAKQRAVEAHQVAAVGLGPRRVPSMGIARSE